MNRAIRLAIVLVALSALAFFGMRAWRSRAAHPAAAASDTVQAGVRSVTLWFAAADGDSLVREDRELVEQDGLHARVTQLVAALEQGPRKGGVSVLPAGTSVLHVYLDDRGLMTLDLSRAFQQGFRGGSGAEALALGSLLRTIGSNVPEARRVLLVCGGAPILSLGGHLPLDRPIDPHEEF
jgi:hypothetical protein